MRLLLSWLRDFVDLPAPADAIAATLGLRGFEVASVEPATAAPAPWQAGGGPDGVIDVEITANRPDCMSVMGLAREVATAFDLPLTLPSAAPGARIAVANAAVGESDRVSVAVEDADLCPRYAAAVGDVAAGGSPGWMAGRLLAAGVRPISAIVDITNYVLLELGQPMHAFDLDKLEGAKLRIRRAHAGELVTTLDGVERRLDAEMLVIADAARAQAIGGVMGGALSEVSASTRTIVFESACFKPVSVRRTSKRLGLKTEASARFERGTNVNLPLVALQRAIWLTEFTRAGHVAGPIVDRYSASREPLRIRLRQSRLALLLGIVVPDGDVERILRRLGFDVTAAADGWDVTAPTFRVDVSREADLIEEVGRHYGFERLVPSFPPATRPTPAPDPALSRDRLVRRVLTAAGLSEAVTFGFIDAAGAAQFAGAQPGGGGLIGVANPLSAKFDTLRPSLLPGLIDSIGHNRRHGRRDVALFEIGTRFLKSTGETRGVGIGWTGAASPEHWSTSTREADFFDVKGVTERLCAALEARVRFEPAQEAFLARGRAAAVIAANGHQPGARLRIVGELSPDVVEGRGLPRQDRIIVGELDLDALWRSRNASDELRRVEPLPRHPFVVRDLSIVVANTLPAEIIRGTILAASAAGAAPLADVGFFDRYRGKGVPEDAVSVSLRLKFQAADRTLTDAEVQRTFEEILAALAREHGAVQR